MSQGATEKNVNFVNIEGYWVPSQMAESWEAGVAALKSDLQQAADSSFVAQHLAAG